MVTYGSIGGALSNKGGIQVNIEELREELTLIIGRRLWPTNSSKYPNVEYQTAKEIAELAIQRCYPAIAQAELDKVRALLLKRCITQDRTVFRFADTPSGTAPWVCITLEMPEEEWQELLPKENETKEELEGKE